ncbi:VirB4 family type IV secretion/conjugal transfer ATPase [Massilia sp. TW-1]|uniref:VirB4 family type IV secretion/conjugal transfer ATPase n=1 Tax=Telluria antibiotica TaxID=2717319 RepID=A0ABX0P6H5_9BURK|nr:VirB4 family type IV secretion/conjugal transfer ATPase [Telluria antibiotica]NIA52545.1 VirB4 family type IV secretion/conjugal transfer ATPase [Telluria antibiotica]
MKTSTSRRIAMRRETLVARNVPYEGHLTPSIIDTSSGECLCVLRLAGAAFECADDDDINNRHARLNRIVMSLADPRITVWQHIVRRRESQYPDGVFQAGYAHEFNERYKARICSENLMVNELFMTVVLRPFRSKAHGLLSTLLSSRTTGDIRMRRAEQVAELDQIVTDLVVSLGYYEPERLCAYEQRGALFSEPAEFFNFLLTGRWEPVPYARVPLKYQIGGARPVFGNETVEIHDADVSRFGAMLGIQSYPSETTPIFLDELLTQPVELVVTQSFEFQAQDAALRNMRMRANRMENAHDAARSQIDEIPEIADDLTSRRTVMGSHHYNVFVKADSLDALDCEVAEVRRVLVDAGIKPAREDLALEAAFWAQLPANFAMRPRLSPINSRNLCGFYPLHNFPVGRRNGNHWGDAIAMLMTAAGTPHYLSLHASDPQAANGGGKKDVGHTVLFGPNGSGKTATVCFLLSMMQKFGVTSVLFSKDRDTEIAARRLGAEVHTLRMDEPTGLAPFQLDPAEPSNIRHLQLLVRKLMSRPVVTETGLEVDTKPLTVQDEKDVDKAIAHVLDMAPAARRLGRVLDFLPKGELYDRLARWCYAREPGRQDGPLAWVFDNPSATIASELGTVRTTVFDTTAFLDDAELRTPIALHLFHLTGRLIDGRRLAVFFAEFWKSIGDKHFAAFLKDLLKTLRKKNGLVVLDSQSPSDALRHPMARTLIEQVATMILFPNPGADRTEYKEGLGLSDREFSLIKTDLPEGSGMFLLKQGRHSVVAKLPLAGMDDDLAVLSARTSNLELMDRLIAQYGEDPAAWASHFDNERKSA